MSWSHLSFLSFKKLLFKSMEAKAEYFLGSVQHPGGPSFRNRQRKDPDWMIQKEGIMK